MAYIVSPEFGMQLADPATIQAFETPVVNSNFMKLENGIVVQKARIDANVATLALYTAGVGRGNLAREVALNPAALSAIADPLIGDKVEVTTPGTGITSFWAECVASPGSAAADWVPRDTMLIADTKANLDAFIAAWIADTDLIFRVGTLVFVTGTLLLYRITSTAGALKLLTAVAPVKPGSVAGTGCTLNADGAVIVAAGGTTFSVNNVYDGSFDHYFSIGKFTLSGTILLTKRLRAAGVDAAGANDYTYETVSYVGATVTGAASTGSSWPFGVLTSPDQRITSDIFNPADAEATYLQARDSASNSTAHAAGTIDGRHILTTAYDGESFIIGSGTILAARVTYYGYNDN